MYCIYLTCVSARSKHLTAPLSEAATRSAPSGCARRWEGTKEEDPPSAVVGVVVVAECVCDSTRHSRASKERRLPGK